MDLDAYHDAWIKGLSENECVKAGEDAWEKNRLDRSSYDSYLSYLYDEWCNSHPDNPANANRTDSNIACERIEKIEGNKI